MTAQVLSSYSGVLYTRGYENDWKKPEGHTWGECAQRIGLAVLPFFSIAPSLRTPLALGTGVLRVWTLGNQLFYCDLDSTWERIYYAAHTAVAIAAVTFTFFARPIGMMITTAQDIIFESVVLISAIREKNYEQIAKSLLRLGGDLLFLALLYYGGLELSIAVLAVQSAILALSALEKFNKEGWLDWFEGLADLSMAGVRLYQTSAQLNVLKRRWEIEEAIKRIYVGSPHEKWQFPSDHVPVGVEVNGVRVMSWNVLNNAYMHWVIDNDTQGLLGSMITDLHQFAKDGITLRDLKVIEMLSEMTRKGDVIALQECGAAFLQELEKQLPDNWEIIRSKNGSSHDQSVILYNRDHLIYREGLSTVSYDAYAFHPRRPIQNCVFSPVDQPQKEIAVINSHIPGDPNKPGPEEFMRYVYQNHREGRLTIALGDNNFERDRMLDASFKAGFKDFSFHSPYKTNIDPYTKESKGIDGIFIVGEHTSRDLAPEDILATSNLAETLALLNTQVAQNEDENVLFSA